jgi:hypothetical protein
MITDRFDVVEPSCFVDTLISFLYTTTLDRTRGIEAVGADDVQIVGDEEPSVLVIGLMLHLTIEAFVAEEVILVTQSLVRTRHPYNSQ